MLIPKVGSPIGPPAYTAPAVASLPLAVVLQGTTVSGNALGHPQDHAYGTKLGRPLLFGEG